MKRTTLWKLLTGVLLVAVLLPLFPGLNATEVAAVTTDPPLPYAMEQYGQHHSGIYFTDTAPGIDGQKDASYILMDAFHDSSGQYNGVFVAAREDGFGAGEIATEYVPVKKWERQIVKEGKIYFDNFNYSVKEIEKILTLDGENLKFKVFSDYIKVDGDTVDVFYTCLPSLADLEEEIIYKESDLPLRMLAYGVARESCIIEGRFDEANQWQIKFERGIKSVVVPKKLKNVIIKERSFY